MIFFQKLPPGLGVTVIGYCSDLGSVGQTLGQTYIIFVQMLSRRNASGSEHIKLKQVRAAVGSEHETLIGSGATAA